MKGRSTAPGAWVRQWGLHASARITKRQGNQTWLKCNVLTVITELHHTGNLRPSLFQEDPFAGVLTHSKAADKLWNLTHYPSSPVLSPPPVETSGYFSCRIFIRFSPQGDNRYRMTEYSELEGIQKDHQLQLLSEWPTQEWNPQLWHYLTPCSNQLSLS